MSSKILLEKLQGIQTVESIMKILKITRKAAIQKVYLLRKEGYVKTKFTSEKKRIYYISKENILGGKSYVEILNEYSPLKLSESKTYKIYGRTPSLEETLIYAIKTQDVRVITAAIGLFRSINNWKLLGKLSRENKVERSVGALYDVARTLFRVRSMTDQLRNNLLPNNTSNRIFMIKGLKSKDFKDIENKWRIYIPLNKADLESFSNK